jgi:precorrin-6B methylase 2
MNDYYAPIPTPGSDRDRDNCFYEILGGGAKFSLLEGFIDLKLPELLGKAGTSLSAGDICRQLKLNEHRGWKFLHDLALCGFLKESQAQACDMSTQYALSDQTKRFFGEDGAEGYFYRELVTFQRYVKDLKIPFVDVLRGADLPEMVKWPPQTKEASQHLETWMTVSADGAIDRLVNSGTLEGSKRILDVGGGDGTIAISLVKEHLPADVHVTVYNLPASAEMARANVEYYECSSQVDVVDGNFLEDTEFPGGYDTIMFNRVMADWSPTVCLMLMKMCKKALAPGGKLIISEVSTHRHKQSHRMQHIEAILFAQHIMC